MKPFEQFVKEDLIDFHNRLRPIYTEWSSGRTDDCLSYYFNHKPRFDKMLEVLRRNNVKTDRVAELGSFLPYTAYSLETLAVDCFDILFTYYNIDNFQSGKFKFQGINLCYNLPTEQYDLKILSEVIEHLPVSLIDLQKRVIDSMNSGEFLLMTYPMAGVNAKDYEKDYGDYERFRHEHLREFTDETVAQFFTDLIKVDEDELTYPAYGRMRIVLYKKG